MKKYFGILLVFSMAWSLVQADIYRYKDENGNIVYSDQPKPGAEEVQLPGLSTFSPGKAPRTASKPPEGKVFHYDSVKIIKPEQDETFNDNTGNVTIQVHIAPSLKGGHTLEYDLDGNKITTNASSHLFQNLPRGSHTVTVQVIDKEGNPVSERASVQFFVHRYSKLLAPNRPKPTPK